MSANTNEGVGGGGGGGVGGRERESHPGCACTTSARIYRLASDRNTCPKMMLPIMRVCVRVCVCVSFALERSFAEREREPVAPVNWFGIT